MRPGSLSAMKTDADIDLTVKRITDDNEFSLLAREWNALLEESSANNFFLRWEWLWCWWNTYRQEDYELCILLAYGGEKLEGIMPCYVKQTRWKNLYNIKRLMFLGTSDMALYSEYMDMICAKGKEGPVANAVMEHITREKLCDDIYLQAVNASSKAAGFIAGYASEKNFYSPPQKKKHSPFITLPDEYETFLKTRQPSMRRKILGNAKRLDGYGDAVFRKTGSASELEDDFKELVRLHQMRWKSRNFPGSFSGRFLHFQHTVMKTLFEQGLLELWFLSVSGKNIAALYNIRYKDKIYFYQAGLDAGFNARLAPGVLLHAHCIRDAINSGLKEYDFLMMGSMDEYKKSWTEEYRETFDIHIVMPVLLKLATSLENGARAAYKSLRNTKREVFRK